MPRGRKTTLDDNKKLSKDQVAQEFAGSAIVDESLRRGTVRPKFLNSYEVKTVPGNPREPIISDETIDRLERNNLGPGVTGVTTNVEQHGYKPVGPPRQRPRTGFVALMDKLRELSDADSEFNR